MIIQSLERAFAILELIAENGGEMRLSEIAETLDLNRTTVHNLLDTLKKLGYLEQKEGSVRYKITNKASLLTGPDCSVLQIRALLNERMQQIACKLDETVFMAMQTGTYFHYDKSWLPDSKRGLPIGLGKDEQMFQTAVGKIFMAFSPSLCNSLRKYYPGVIDTARKEEFRDIHQKHYAIDLEQYQQGLNCIAFPIMHKNKVLTVVGTFGPSSRLNQNKLDQAIILFTQEIKSLENLLKECKS